MREEEIYAALKAAFPGMKPSVPPADVDPATRAALDAVPGIEAWDDLSPSERERRERVLTDIRRRIVENGVRRAVPDADRGRLFMPFAALTGYDGMIADVEDEVGKG
ncbi:hypothetical protein [Enorma phocaeensis]|uniref:hypothetical protein n=1 Tax=Enorma phocaeensis TaxID=1871019 RepID=UPI000C83E6D4|nr:hypothetical protein [Enorma phocaeensis]